VEVLPSDVGLGIFATRPRAVGERILELHGRVIDFLGTVAKGDRECDALQIGPDLYLDLEDPGRCTNHSCEPNSGVRSNGTTLVAVRPIGAGEEVRFDYSTTMDDGHWTMDCSCGSSHCRGRVLDFRWLPTHRKLHYIGLGIVPSFLVAAELERGALTSREIHRSVARVIAPAPA
jgi:hypothetical protein